MTLDSVCFDLDDTLYNYEHYARAGLRNAAKTLEEQTGEWYFDELVEIYFAEERTEGTFDILLDRHAVSPEVTTSLVDAFHNATSPLSPYPETEPMLQTLAGSYQLGLITDGRGGQQKLDRLGIRQYFDEILVTPQIDRSKHEQVVFEQVLNALGADPRNAIYVGDDPRVDFPIPNDIGMYTVRLCRGRYRSLDPRTKREQPDYRIQSLNALIHTISAIE